jgi:hypothetical protein
VFLQKSATFLEDKRVEWQIGKINGTEECNSNEKKEFNSHASKAEACGTQDRLVAVRVLQFACPGTKGIIVTTE